MWFTHREKRLPLVEHEELTGPYAIRKASACLPKSRGHMVSKQQHHLIYLSATKLTCHQSFENLHIRGFL